jgi:hypothetical protein
VRALLLVCALAVPVRAGESGAFLKIPAGARAVGLGSAYTALADDAAASAWNPAGLGGLRTREFTATHAEMFEGLRHEFLAAAAPTRLGTLGLAAELLNQGSLEGRDAQGRPDGSFEASDRAVTLALGRSLGGGRLGGGVRFIESTLADATARTVAFDLGAQAAAGRIYGLPLAFGAAARNLGPGLKYGGVREPLPTTVSAGAAVRLPAGLTFTVDWRWRPNAEKTEVGVGTEYAVLSGVALRAGYATTQAPQGRGGGALGGFSGLGAGLGLKVGRMGLDYAFTPFGELGNVQRISLGSRW